MNDMLKSAVMLSILSNPSKSDLWNKLSDSPFDVVRKVTPELLKTQEIIGERYSFNAEKASELIISRCEDKKIRIISIWDDEYPLLLKEIHNPPIVLYLIGKISNIRMISVVGTRNSDIKSDEITKKISVRASSAGFTIVSGMALGIDRSAHIGALSSGGSTVAVLPGGVDVVYPYKNSDLYRMICDSENSAVISEYPPGTGTGQKWTFARRNRLISGLSEAVIIVQAPLKSGAMITAKYAVEQNRDLYVCPGNAFDEKYSGCNDLIRQGAAIFSEMSDLFEEKESALPLPDISVQVKKETKPQEKPVLLNINKENSPIIKESANPVERKIIEDLNSGLIDIDLLIRSNSFTADEVNQAITILEIEGIIIRRGNRLIKS